eukprot:jgi/Bigna1/87810/estExt_fgenesh1_pg.C_240156
MGSGSDLSDREKWYEIGYQVLAGACVYAALVLFALFFRRQRVDGVPDPFTSCSLYVKSFSAQFKGDIAFSILAALNMFFCITFILRAYEKDYPGWMQVTEMLATVIFMVQVVFDYGGSNTKLLFLGSISNITNIFAIASTWYQVTNNFYLGLGFLRSINCLTCIGLLKYRDVLCGSLGKELFMLISTVISYVFVFAGLIFIIESLGDIPGVTYEPTEWSIFNSFYFMIVTLSTVGYGDFFATTLFGRLVMICCIAVGIIIFGAQTGELVAIIQASNLGRGRFRNSDYSKFVVFCGELNEDILDLAMNQILHPERLEKLGSDTKIVVLCVNEAQLLSFRAYFFADNDKDRDVVKNLLLFVGNPLNSDDLQRIQIENAEAVFVVGPESSEFIEARDLKLMYTAVAVRRYLKVSQAAGTKYHVPINIVISQWKHFQIYNHPLLTDPLADVDVVSYNKHVNTLLASSCFAPGFLPFLSSIITTIGSREEEGIDGDPEWLRLYLEGADNEIFSFRPKNDIYDRSFWEIYKEMGENRVLLIGYVRKNGWVYLAPGEKHCKIPKGASLVAIAANDSALSQYRNTELDVETSKGHPMQIAIQDQGLLKSYKKAKIVMKQTYDLSGVARVSTTISNTPTSIDVKSAANLSEAAADNSELYESDLTAIRDGWVRFTPFALETESLDSVNKISFEIYGTAEDEQDVVFLGSASVKPEDFKKSVEATSDSVELKDSILFRTEILSDGQKANLLVELPTRKKKGKKNEDLKVVDRNIAARAKRQAIIHTQRSARLAEKVKQLETVDGRDEQARLMMVEVKTGKRLPCILDNGHVIIFDPKPGNLKYLLQPIKRRRKMCNQRAAIKIVIIHRQKLSSCYSSMSDAYPLMDGVYWVRNSVRDVSLFTEIRAGRASQIIISTHGLKGGEDDASDYDLPEDAPAMFLTVQLSDFLKRSHNAGGPYVPVVTELQSEATMGMMQYWNDQRRFTHPLYAEGSVVVKNIPQLLLMQSLDSQFLLKVFTAMVITSNKEGTAQAYGIKVQTMVKASGFTGTNWGDLRRHFTERKKSRIIPMALFTSREEEQKLYRFCVTHPKDNLPLRIETDRVIVLSAKVPQEVLMDLKKDERAIEKANEEDKIKRIETKRLAESKKMTNEKKKSMGNLLSVASSGSRLELHSLKAALKPADKEGKM